MFFNSEESTNEKIDRLVKMEHDLQQQLKSIFDNIGIAPEELNAYLSDRENFTEGEWNKIQESKREMEERLERDLTNLANPARAKRGMRAQRRTAGKIMI